MSGWSFSSTYLIELKIAEGMSIADKLPALKLNAVGCSKPISSVEMMEAFIPLFIASIPKDLVVVLLPHSWEVPPTKITGAFASYEILGNTSQHFSGATPQILRTTSNLGLISLMQTSFCSASFNKDSFSDNDKDLNETTAFLPFANA